MKKFLLSGDVRTSLHRIIYANSEYRVKLEFAKKSYTSQTEIRTIVPYAKSELVGDATAELSVPRDKL
jgi:hypothetical protein